MTLTMALHSHGDSGDDGTALPARPLQLKLEVTYLLAAFVTALDPHPHNSLLQARATLPHIGRTRGSSFDHLVSTQQ